MQKIDIDLGNPGPDEFKWSADSFGESSQASSKALHKLSNRGMDGGVRWLGNSFYATIDQAFISGSNFVPNIFLARWLSPNAYGAFALGFTAMLLADALHAALIVEPLLVFGRTRYHAKYNDYVSTVFGTQLIFSVSCSSGFALVGAACGLLNFADLPATFITIAAASPVIHFRSLMRYACILNLNYRLAALGSMINFIAVTTCMIVIQQLNLLSTPVTFVVFACASMLSGVWIGKCVGVRLRPTKRRLWRSVLARHARYARWSTYSRLLIWIRSCLPYVILPVFAGLEAGGTFRALQNLIMPAMNVNVALCPVLLPLLAQRGNRTTQNRVIIRILAALVPLMFAYWVVLYLVGPMFLDLLYRGKYNSYTSLIWLFGLIPVLECCSIVFECSFLARERPDVFFLASLLGAATALTVVVVMIAHMGLFGAVLGLVLVSVVTLFTLAAVYFREMACYAYSERRGG